jgi:hypothetical protein
MQKNLTLAWPAVGALAVFTAAVLGGYAYYVHAVLLPAEDLAVQQRALAVQGRDGAGQREASVADNASLNTLALMQVTQALTRMAMSNGPSNSAAATMYGGPAPTVQPTVQQPAYFPASAPPMGYYADTVRLALPPQPPYMPPPAPGIVTYTYAPPQPWVETMPQVLTAGYYAYPQRRLGETRFGQTNRRPERH